MVFPFSLSHLREPHLPFRLPEYLLVVTRQRVGGAQVGGLEGLVQLVHPGRLLLGNSPRREGDELQVKIGGVVVFGTEVPVCGGFVRPFVFAYCVMLHRR